jgi:hypothetical protein
MGWLAKGGGHPGVVPAGVVQRDGGVDSESFVDPEQTEVERGVV